MLEITNRIFCLASFQRFTKPPCHIVQKYTSSSRLSAAVEYSDELNVGAFLKRHCSKCWRLLLRHWSCNGKSTQYTSHFRIYCPRHWFVYHHQRSNFSLLKTHRSITTYLAPARLLRPTQFRNCFRLKRMAMAVLKKRKKRQRRWEYNCGPHRTLQRLSRTDHPRDLKGLKHLLVASQKRGASNKPKGRRDAASL